MLLQLIVHLLLIKTSEYIEYQISRIVMEPQAENSLSKPTCPVCLEIPFEPMVGTCGHTICIGCREKMKTNICPMCRQRVGFKPNFMMKDFLVSDPLYAQEYKARQLEYIASTPQGQLDSILKKYPGIRINSSFNIEDQVSIMNSILNWIEHRKRMGTFTGFTIPFQTSHVFISLSHDFYAEGGSLNFLDVYIGGYFFRICSKTKRLIKE